MFLRCRKKLNSLNAIIASASDITIANFTPPARVGTCKNNQMFILSFKLGIFLYRIQIKRKMSESNCWIPVLTYLLEIKSEFPKRSYIYSGEKRIIFFINDKVEMYWSCKQ